MATWEIPPKAKVYEALTAVASDHVHLLDETSAKVVSSNKKKTYQVQWSSDGSAITSNDNASYYQGYLGYPILAVLMKLKRLSYDPQVADWLAGIQWKIINVQFKNNYDRAVDHVLSTIENAVTKREQIETEVERIYIQVKQLHLERLKSSIKPPK